MKSNQQIVKISLLFSKTNYKKYTGCHINQDKINWLIKKQIKQKSILDEGTAQRIKQI